MPNVADSNKDGAQDAAILFPERNATIAGVTVVMREYSYHESLVHHALIGALCDAMTGVALDHSFHDLDSLRSAFGENAEAVEQLVAIACDQPVEWVRVLGADDGEQLQMLWWGVNDAFFLKRVLLSVRLRKVRELDGRTSSASLSPPGTTREPSEATPADS